MHHAQRRQLLSFLATSALYAALPLRGAQAAERAQGLVQALAKLEALHGGRLGVQVSGWDGGEASSHRGDERFGLCSTFKLLLAAVVLREAQHGRIDLNRSIRFGKADLVPYAPVIEKHLDAGALSVRELAHAAQTTSDNVAANLLLRELGGPEGLTAKLRELGDTVTRIDRIEPGMNFVPPGEVRDTTTPRAMAETVHRLFTSDLLNEASQRTLKAWMVETRTGLRRLRAGLPADWEVGDKTGTGYAPGMPNKHNDVAVVWRPGQAPRVIAAYWEADGHYPRMRAEDDAVLAEVGRLVAQSA